MDNYLWTQITFLVAALFAPTPSTMFDIYPYCCKCAVFIFFAAWMCWYTSNELLLKKYQFLKPSDSDQILRIADYKKFLYSRSTKNVAFCRRWPKTDKSKNCVCFALRAKMLLKHCMKWFRWPIAILRPFPNCARSLIGSDFVLHANGSEFENAWGHLLFAAFTTSEQYHIDIPSQYTKTHCTSADKN